MTGSVKPRVCERTSELEQVFKEYVIETTLTPVGRFVKQTATVGKVGRATTAGERIVGVSLECPIPTVSNRLSDFADYAIGDTALVAIDPERYVTMEASNQGMSAPSLTDLITTDAVGKAVVTTTSGHFVAGVNPEIVTVDGLVYIRFLPTWQALKVVP